MPTTTNKGYEVQVTGTNTDTWGDVLNEDVIEIIDRNLGGIVTKTLAASNVVLTAEESQSLMVRLEGTISAAILVTTAAVGMTIVENLTSGAFAVTFGNGVGSPVTIAQNTRAVVITDGTNGPRIAADNAAEFASGTRMVFQQTAAPTNWTKESSATYNEAALQFVTGSVGTGGSLAFGSAFASRSLSGTVGNTTLTESQIPSHRHFGFADTFNTGVTLSASTQVSKSKDIASQSPNYIIDGANSDATLGRSGATGGGQAHNHSLSISNLDLAVKYVSCIIAQKN